ncbi:MAG TPA: hypothetical protein O0X25_04040 [Methanocorpusculum sp.]|nr:hypothetical protein [Methanocorpusculum sp.]
MEGKYNMVAFQGSSFKEITIAKSEDKYQSLLNSKFRILDGGVDYHTNVISSNCASYLAYFKRVNESYNLFNRQYEILQEKENIYQNSVAQMKLKTEDGYAQGLSLLLQIPVYKNAEELITFCQKKLKQIQDDREERARLSKCEEKYVYACAEMKLNTINSYNNAIHSFEEITDYKDSKSLLEQCKDNQLSLKLKEDYETAIMLMDNEHYYDAAVMFKHISGYRDSEKLGKRCLALSKKRPKKEKVRDNNTTQKSNHTANPKTVKICVIVGAIIVAIILVILLFVKVILPILPTIILYGCIGIAILVVGAIVVNYFKS